MFRNASAFGVYTLTVVFAAILFSAGVFADSSEEDDAISTTLDNGLGSHIDWHTLDDGLSLAKQEKKPLMLIIHKSWCGACKSLKPKFRSSEKITKLSKSFIMVNTMDDDEPPGDAYKPDGGYIPRLLFFDPEGELLTDVINEEGNPQYKYYYYDETSIMTSMEKVAALFPASSDNDINDKDDDDSLDRNKVKSEL